MKKLLITTLEQFNYPVKLQGSLSHKEYPDTFFTFWNFDTVNTYIDNKIIRTTWGFWIYLYSTDPEIVENVMNDAIQELRKAGFIIEGQGIDAVSDQVTHTGRMITAYLMENLEA